MILWHPVVQVLQRDEHFVIFTTATSPALRETHKFDYFSLFNNMDIKPNTLQLQQELASRVSSLGRDPARGTSTKRAVHHYNIHNMHKTHS